VLLLLPSLAGLFIYSLPEGLLLPHSLGLGAPRPLCYMSFSFLFSCLFIIQFVFFPFFPPWVRVSLSRGLYWSGPVLSVGVPYAA
jgi:hypothetical protein